MPGCGDIESGTIAFYVRSRIKMELFWFSRLGIDDKFTNEDLESPVRWGLRTCPELVGRQGLSVYIPPARSHPVHSALKFYFEIPINKQGSLFVGVTSI